VANRFEILREKATKLWFVVEENDHGWYVGSSMLSHKQAKKRRWILLRDFHMTEIRVVKGGDLFMVVDSDSRRVGGAYATESECRRAHNLMDFAAMGHYAPEERRSSRFVRVLHEDVV